MAAALAATKAGLPVATASKRFGVPRITLRNKLKGISPEVCNMGPSTILSTQEELRIVTWLVDIAKAGFPVTKQGLVDTVAKLIKDLDRKTPFRDGIPGKKWFKAFLKRHPNISLKTSEKLTGYRGRLTEGDIRNWFEEVTIYLKENNYYDILENGNRIFNADETAISLCPKTGKVLAPKGIKNIYDVSKTSEKENLTVLLTVDASGSMAPPMVVYPYKRIPSEIAENFPKGWGLGKSVSGWMSGELFFEYMANIFEPWLKKNNIERPVIFFVDGHRSHLTLHLSMFLREKEIILVAFYPNATHMMQPLDVAVFYPLKSKWKTYVRKWLVENENKQFLRRHVAKLLETILRDAISPDIIKNGFRVCGLFPFNANAVDYSKIIYRQADVTDNKESQDNMHDDIKTCLKVLESNIEKNTLEIIKQHNLKDEWRGPESAKDLYYTWIKIQKLKCVYNTSEKNINILVDENPDLNFSLEVDDTNRQCEEQIPVPQEATDHSEVLQEILEQVTEDLHVTVSSNKIQTTPQKAQVSAKEFEILDNARPSTSKSTNSFIDNAYFQLPFQETAAETQQAGTDHTNGADYTVEICDTGESPFKKYLFWPKQDENSFKKVREKPRSVITSDFWFHEQQKKEALKLEKEQLKERRKRAREDKQKEKKMDVKKPKALKRKAQIKGRKSAVSMENWKCYKCKINWKDLHILERKAKWLSCFSCPNKVHKACVGFKYLNSLGKSFSDSEEDTEFVCEKCGITIDTSDDHDAWSSEEEEEY